jgi:hypothetical protein
MPRAGALYACHAKGAALEMVDDSPGCDRSGLQYSSRKVVAYDFRAGPISDLDSGQRNLVRIRVRLCVADRLLSRSLG